MFDPKGRDSWEGLHGETADQNLKARDRAILWARDRLRDDFVVLDTETTGLNEDDEVVQVAVVGKTGRVLLECLLKPRKLIPPGASAVHGIRDEDVEGAVDIYDLLPVLHSILQEKQVLIYNADYDLRLIRQSLRMRGLDGLVGQGRAWCVMEEFARYYGEWNEYHGNYKWQKLARACQYFNLPVDGAHGAAAAARMTLRVVERMAQALTSQEREAETRGLKEAQAEALANEDDASAD